MKETFWGTGTANHLWRAYFTMLRSDQQPSSPADRKTMDVCSAVYPRFGERDREIIKAYYTCKWGDTVYAVEDYSARTGIPVPSIYSVLTRARYEVITELGLMNPYGYEKR